MVILFSFIQCQTKVTEQSIDWSGKEQHLQSVELPFDTCATLDICGDIAFVAPDMLILPQIRREEYLTSYKLSDDSLLFQNVIIRKGNAPFETLNCPGLFQLNNGIFVIAASGWQTTIFVSKTNSLEELKNIRDWERYKLPDSVNISTIASTPDNQNQLYGTMMGSSTLFFQYNLDNSTFAPIQCEYPKSEFEPSEPYEYAYAYRGKIRGSISNLVFQYHSCF